MDQSYPLKAYATDYTSEVDHDASTSGGLRQQSRSKPTFSVHRKPLTRQHEQNNVDYEPLTESAAIHRPVAPQKIQKESESVPWIMWWMPEIFASVLAIVCVIAIVIVLRSYEGRALTEVNLPKSLTLNGIIAAISTIARIALMVPLASGLSQESWIWFSNNSERQECHSRLKDLDLSDSASRGAWGSILFLLSARRRWVAYVGALTTIISLAFGTFTQQLLAVDQVKLAQTSDLSPKNIPRTETWQYMSIRPSEGAQSLPLELRAAIYAGMLTEKVDQINVQCTTGNCTWPTTPSLAVCGGCSSSPYSQACDRNFCNYTMPSGTRIQLTNDEYGSQVGFVVNSSSKGSIYSEKSNDRAYIVHFDAVGAPYGTPDVLFKNSNITSSECALWMCVKSFNTTMLAGRIQENVTMEFSTLKRPTTALVGGFDNYTFADLPAAMHPDPASTYNVSGFGLYGFSATLQQLLNGTASLNQGGSVTQNDAFEAIWNASANLDPWIKNVADSLTNALRYDNQNPHPRSYQPLYPTPERSIYDGTADTLGIHVQWYFLILPIACVALSILFLVMVMIKTAGSPVVPWKSGLMTSLFFEVEQELKQQASHRLNHQNGVLNAVGDQKVVLKKDHEGKWAFKTV